MAGGESIKGSRGAASRDQSNNYLRARIEVANEVMRDMRYLRALKRLHLDVPWLLRNFPDGIIPVDTQVSHLPMDGNASRRAGDPVWIFEKLYHRERTIECAQSIEVRSGGSSYVVAGYPGITAQWYQVDPLRPRSFSDDMGRSMYGPTWSKNSCALDCVLTVLLQLNAGRVLADQVWETLLQPANAPSKLVLLVVRKPWSKLSLEQRGVLRDIIREALVRLRPEIYSMDGMMSVGGILEDLVGAVPQLHATWLLRERCCDKSDWAWRHRRDGELYHQRRLWVPYRSAKGMKMDPLEDLGIQLRRHLQKTPHHNYKRLRPCSQPGCKPASTACHQYIILDRAPPTLALGDFVSTDEGRPIPVSCFQPLNLSFLVYGDRLRVDEARYAFFACILYKANHFVLCVNTAVRGREQQIYLYDGMGVGGTLTALTVPLERYVRDGRYGLSCLVFVRMTLPELKSI